MRLPYRKPITSTTTEQLQKALTSVYGDGKQKLPLDFTLTGPGWNDIIFNLHNQLKQLDPHYRVMQVKEKFGTLRYYIHTDNNEAHNIIIEAETASSHTCEQCGRPGTLHTTRRWLKTLCTIDAIIDKINITSWIIRRNTLTFGFKTFFTIRRLIRKNTTQKNKPH